MKKVQTIIIYIKTIAQKDPKTTKIVIKGAIAFIAVWAAKRGFDLSPDVLSFLIMAIVTWLGINASDGTKDTTKETLSITTTTTKALPSPVATLDEAIDAPKESERRQ